ncbi:MAG: hypothetical protein ACOCRK_01510 [bacterium]
MIKNDFDFIGWQEKILMVRFIHEDYLIRSGKEIAELLDPLQRKWFKNIQGYKDKKFITSIKISNLSKPFTVTKEQHSMSIVSELLYDINKLKTNNEKSILKFASKYGLPNRVYKDNGLENKEYENLHKFVGALVNSFYPLDEFIREVRKIKEILSIHKKLLELSFIDMERNTSKISILKKYFYDEINKKQPNIELKVVGVTNKKHFDYKNLSNKDLLLLFITYLKKVISTRIVNNVSPVFTNPEYTPEDENLWSLSAAWHCKDLFTTIYLQLFFIITKKKEVRYCLHCETPFSVDKNDQEYCSSSCRVKANNYRKKMTIKLFKEGYSINQIYEKLEKRSSKDKIAEWINKIK